MIWPDFINSGMSQNCRFFKEKYIFFPFFCASKGCKKWLDQDFQKIYSDMFSENKNKKIRLDRCNGFSKNVHPNLKNTIFGKTHLKIYNVIKCCWKDLRLICENVFSSYVSTAYFLHHLDKQYAHKKFIFWNRYTIRLP